MPEVRDLKGGLTRDRHHRLRDGQPYERKKGL